MTPPAFVVFAMLVAVSSAYAQPTPSDTSTKTQARSPKRVSTVQHWLGAPG
jgi:hypothetical protein